MKYTLTFLARFGYPKDFADLDNHRLIAFYDNERGNLGNVDWMLTIGAPDGKKRVPYLQLSSSIALYFAAMRGIGIAPVTNRRDGIFADSELVDIFPSYVGHTLDLFYIYPSTMKDSTRIQTFGAFLKKIVADHDKKVDKNLK